MGDLDDGPEQKPLQEDVLDCMILDLLPPIQFDLIITHNPTGEYTRHLRHEETSKAVIELWFAGKITTAELWTFAYEDGGKTYYPQAVKNTPIYRELDEETWRAKYQLITQTYGFKKSSWEAKTTPRAESFWRFFNPDEAVKWLNNGGTRT